MPQAGARAGLMPPALPLALTGGDLDRFRSHLMSLCLISQLPDSNFPKLLRIFILLQSLPIDTIFFQQHLFSFLFIKKMILKNTNISHQLIQLFID